MKLTRSQIEELAMRTGALPIPEDSRVGKELATLFGDHTFYVDDRGLIVWEVIDCRANGGFPLNAVQIGIWVDEEQTELAPHDPIPTTTVVELGSPWPDPAA